jgi:hypothetical protein
MSDSNPTTPGNTYTWRDTNVAKEVHGVRTAASVGGSITVGLAKLVVPGEMIGSLTSAIRATYWILRVLSRYTGGWSR